MAKNYDELYAKASEVLAKYNPCQIRQEPDGSISCVDTRANSHRDSTLCCTGCQHLRASGCSVKSLACRFWLCTEVKFTPAGKDAADELLKLDQEAHRLHVKHDFRASRASNLSSPFTIIYDFTQ